MQISSETIAALKNLATINQSLLFKEGRSQETISVANTVYATIELVDSFPREFGIYDLTEFLNTLSMFDNPEIEFGDDHLTLTDTSGANCRYNYADSSIIVSPKNKKDLSIPNPIVSFCMTQANFDKIRKAASVLTLPDLAVRNDGGKLMIGTIDKATDTSNNFEICVGDCDEDATFEIHIRTELLKLLVGDYDVEISSMGFSRWVGHNNNAEYVVALEKTSNFG